MFNRQRQLNHVCQVSPVGNLRHSCSVGLEKELLQTGEHTPLLLWIILNQLVNGGLGLVIPHQETAFTLLRLRLLFVFLDSLETELQLQRHERALVFGPFAVDWNGAGPHGVLDVGLALFRARASLLCRAIPCFRCLRLILAS